MSSPPPRVPFIGTNALPNDVNYVLVLRYRNRAQHLGQTRVAGPPVKQHYSPGCCLKVPSTPPGGRRNRQQVQGRTSTGFRLGYGRMQASAVPQRPARCICANPRPCRGPLPPADASTRRPPNHDLSLRGQSACIPPCQPQDVKSPAAWPSGRRTTGLPSTIGQRPRR